MKTFLLISAIGLLVGCNKANSEPQPVNRDNTAVNARDNDSRAKTPIDQNENQRDVNLTAEIRRRVVESDVSINAKNCKIITQNGRVTLRGPVNSDQEKQEIRQMALTVAGAGQVDDQLEVKQ